MPGIIRPVRPPILMPTRGVGSLAPPYADQGGGGAWTPAKLGASLPRWFRADLGTTIATGVSTWANQGSDGSAANLTQGTGSAQPTVSTLTGGNGRPALAFSAAASQFLSNASALSGSAAHVFAVFQINTDPPAVAANCGLWRLGTAASVSAVPFTDGIIYDEAYSTTRQTTVNPTPSLTSVHCYEVISTGSEWTSLLDGVQLFTTATNTFSANATWLIGNSAAGNFLDGKLAELLVCNAKQTTNRPQIVSYLNARYALGMV